MKKQVHYWIYSAYEPWAIKQAYDFKKRHPFKSRSINIDDYILSSKIGLYKSIKNYQGTSPFVRYSEIYIRGELYHCLTDFHLLTNVPKNLRKKHKESLTPQERKKYKNQLRTTLVEYKDYWKFDKCYHTQQDRTPLTHFFQKMKDAELANQIKDSLPVEPAIQQVFYRKFNTDFVSIKSNRVIAEQMGYSEEWVREKVKLCIQRLRENFPSLILTQKEDI
jgi:RNA polymerase sigma factor (sigma-70 family)